MENSARNPAAVFRLKIKIFTRGVAAFATLLGLLVLVGWAFGLTRLTVVIPGLASMKPNTAACLALCGISLWCLLIDASRKSRAIEVLAGISLALIAVLVGVATLAEYAFHRNFGIDQLLFVDWFGDGHSIPGRMAPNTAVCFVVLGVALALIPTETKRGYRPAQFLSLIPACISLMSILGYLYSVISFYQIASFTGMAVHTATVLFLLSLGVFFSSSDRGLVAAISNNSLGGILLRRLLPVASVVPIVIGWFRIEGQKAGWYGSEFGLALMVTVDVAFFAVVIYLSGAEIDRIALARREVERTLRGVEDNLRALDYTFESVVRACPLPIITLDRESNVQIWNRAAELMFGWSGIQVRAKPIDLSPDDRLQEFCSIIDILAQGDPVSGIQTVMRTRDDTKVAVMLWAAPIVVGSSEISGSVLILQNVVPAERPLGLREKVHS